MTEAELCALFRTAATGDGWTVYPEVDGWDLLLVWERKARPPTGVRRGDQVAVEAKSRASVTAMAQCLDRCEGAVKGPDFRAVLAPRASEDFRRVAGALGIGIYTLEHCRPGERTPRSRRKRVRAPERRMTFDEPLWTPPVVSEGPGGAPSPRALTPWRVKALRICALLRTRGWVTSKDFEAAGVSMTNWRKRWIRRDGSVGRLARYVLAEAHDFPDIGFEAERDALAALAE